MRVVNGTVARGTAFLPELATKTLVPSIRRALFLTTI